MVWLLSNIMERCRCLLMAFPAFLLFILSRQKPQNAGKTVSNMVSVYGMCVRDFSKNNFAVF